MLDFSADGPFCRYPSSASGGEVLLTSLPKLFSFVEILLHLCGGAEPNSFIFLQGHDSLEHN